MADRASFGFSCRTAARVTMSPPQAVNWQRSAVRGNQVRHVAVAVLDGLQQGHLGTVGLGVGIGAVLEQHLHHRQIVVLGRGHEGKGEIVVGFLGVGIGARGQQQRDDVAPAELGRARQRPLLARRLKMDRPGSAAKSERTLSMSPLTQARLMS